MQMKETGDLLFNKFLKFEICKNYFLFSEEIIQNVNQIKSIC